MTAANLEQLNLSPVNTLFSPLIFAYPPKMSKLKQKEFMDTQNQVHEGQYNHNLTFAFLVLMGQLRFNKKDLRKMFLEQPDDESKGFCKPTRKDFKNTLITQGKV